MVLSLSVFNIPRARNCKQLFSEVEVRREGYSPRSECGEAGEYTHFSPTQQKLIVLTYNKTVNRSKQSEEIVITEANLVHT